MPDPELLDFLARWLGPIGAPPDYQARLAAYFANNFDLMFAGHATPKRLEIELTPRGLVMLARLPPLKV